jgi:hypothetical protein
MLEIAMSLRGDIKKQLAVLEDERKAITGPIDKAKKVVMDLFGRLSAPREEAVAAIDTEVRSWRKKESDRLALEKAQADEAARIERVRLEGLAKAAQEAGKVEEAQVLAQTAAVVVAAPEQAMAKVAGASFAKVWKGQVTDVAQFLRYLADHADRQGCVEFKESELNALARAVKGSIPIPGFKAEEVEQISSR